ncbi:hypothetical protein L9F63_002273, partial [Diploptera punctata]
SIIKISSRPLIDPWRGHFPSLVFVKPINNMAPRVTLVVSLILIASRLSVSEPPSHG